MKIATIASVPSPPAGDGRAARRAAIASGRAPSAVRISTPAW